MPVPHEILETTRPVLPSGTSSYGLTGAAAPAGAASFFGVSAPMPDRTRTALPTPASVDARKSRLFSFIAGSLTGFA